MSSLEAVYRRADIPVRSTVLRQPGQQIPALLVFGESCGQDCPLPALNGLFPAEKPCLT
jgi:hypothetical protein